jgi:hypothetical protein
MGAFLAGTCPANAADLLRKDVIVGSAVERSCTASKLNSGSGYVQQKVTVPVTGAVVANLMAASGDWDLAVFNADNGRVVAGSASRGAREIADGYSVAGQKLVVQACRLSGSASSAGLSVQSLPIDTSNVQKSSLVRVSTPTAARKRAVTFEGPPPAQAAQEESWTLFCEQPEGVIRSARQVFVARGEKRTLDLRTDCKVRR